jgi:uncharacterized RDD family membrane protein YckC
MINENQTSELTKRSEIARMMLDDEWRPVVQQDYEKNAWEDDISFRPITDGLGFSEPKEPIINKRNINPEQHTSDAFKYISRPSRNKEKILADMSQRVVSNSNPTFQQIGLNTETKNSHLAAFYQDSNVTKDTTQAKKKKRKLKKASPEARIVAWGVDTIIITTMLIGFAGVLTTLFKLDFLSLINISNLGFLLSAWSLFYVIYFTILDLDRSFGKSLLQLKTVKSKGTISIVDTFVRTVVSLVSIGCFFIPTLFDLHGNLSDTKVVRWK